MGLPVFPLMGVKNSALFRESVSGLRNISGVLALTWWKHGGLEGDKVCLSAWKCVRCGRPRLRKMLIERRVPAF